MHHLFATNAGIMSDGLQWTPFSAEKWEYLNK